MSTTAERYTPEFYLAHQKDSKAHIMATVALVRVQEKEKERNYLMRYEQDPEDHTLRRWVKVRPLTEREKKAHARKLAKQQETLYLREE